MLDCSTDLTTRSRASTDDAIHRSRLAFEQRESCGQILENMPAQAQRCVDCATDLVRTRGPDNLPGPVAAFASSTSAPPKLSSSLKAAHWWLCARRIQPCSSSA